MAVDEALRRERERVCLEHMTAENAHDFARCIAAFAHPRYELIGTDEVYDGQVRVNQLLLQNQVAFPDFQFGVEAMHYADAVVVVEGTFRGTHLGPWRGLPATGRRLELLMAVIFQFEGADMICERVFFDFMTMLAQLGVAHDVNTARGKLLTMLNHPLTFGRAMVRKIGGGR